MATGDLTNNIRKLQQEVKRIKYEEPLDLTSLSKGVASAFLPIYHYTFTMFSPSVLEKIVEMDIGLFGKSDLKFMEGVYRVLRDMFNYKPPITKDQFFSSGFSERKIIMCAEVIDLVNKKHRSLRPQKENGMNSFKVNSTLSASSRNRSKVGFQGPRSSGYVVERGDSKPQGVRKVAGQTNRRPHSALANSGNTGSNFQGLQIATPEPSIDPCPKTPGILKATSSAVQVVYVPRAPVNSSGDIVETTQAPVDVVATSPAKSDGGAGEPDIICNTDQLSQIHQANALQVPVNSSLHRSMAMVMHRLEMIEVDMKCCTSKAESADDPKISNLLQDVQSKMETAMARLLLLENRMTMVEAKIQSRLNTEESCGTNEGKQVTAVSVPPPAEVLIGGVCPSPIKHSPSVNDVNLIANIEHDSPQTEVRASTPTEKLNSSLIFTCVDKSTKEKAERLNAMLKNTAEVLQSVAHS